MDGIDRVDFSVKGTLGIARVRVATVPEPASVGLLATGVALLGITTRRARH